MVPEEFRQKAYLKFLHRHISPHKAALFAEKAALRTRHLTLVLENVFQPHNASAVLRSCDCFGIQEVHVVSTSNAFETVPEVSLGSSRWLHILQDSGPNALQNILLALKEKGYTIWATSPHKDDLALEQMPVEAPIALLLGTEMQGLSKEALDLADRFVRIPMVGFTESLNLSVAAAVSMHHLSWKIRSSNLPWRLSPDEQLELQIDWAERATKRSEALRARFLENTGR